MKNRFLWLCSLILSIACLTACAAPSSSEMSANQDDAMAAAEEPLFLSDSSGNHREQLTEYGRLERLRMEIPADAPICVQAENFSISIQEIDALAGEYTFFHSDDPDEARQKAQDSLIAKYAVYTYALSQGCQVEDATLDALIADEQDSDEMNPSDFKIFLKGFDADASLYWSLRREDLRMYQTIDLFKETCRSSYSDETIPFETYYADLVAGIIESEDVRIVS